MMTTLQQVNQSKMWYNYTSSNRIVDRGATGIAHGLSPEKELLMSHNDTLGAPALKTCSKCKESKPLSQFNKLKTAADGLNTRCKECTRAYYRKWYSDEESHRQSVLDAARQYRQENADDVRAMWRRLQAIRPSNRSEKSRAGNAVADAVRYEKFPPAWTMVCDHCQEALAAHWHHHKGYSGEHKLDVIALCLDCHGYVHRKERP